MAAIFSQFPAYFRFSGALVTVLIRSLSADCGIWAVDTRTRRTIEKRGVNMSSRVS